MTARNVLPRACVFFLALALCCARASRCRAAAYEGVPVAAGTIQGVGTMGYGAPAPGVPPRSSFGDTPGDFRRGYEGNIPGNDPWGREADFKDRSYRMRHGPQPQYAAPPPDGTGSGPGAATRPPLSKPPLPGDRDMPADSPAPAGR